LMGEGEDEGESPGWDPGGWLLNMSYL